jgi:hypothetical protein
MTQRFYVKPGEEHRSGTVYCVWDSENKTLRFSSDSMVLCIQISQRLNGFEPADGIEQTYRQQCQVRDIIDGEDTSGHP